MIDRMESIQQLPDKLTGPVLATEDVMTEVEREATIDHELMHCHIMMDGIE